MELADLLLLIQLRDELGDGTDALELMNLYIGYIANVTVKITCSRPSETTRRC